MKNKVVLCLILIFGIISSGCVLEPEYTLYVVQHVTPQARGEITDSHTEYTVFNEHEISGYYSKWKGDLNNTAAIETDYGIYDIWVCDVDTDQPCKEIKSGDILSVKGNFITGWEREIVGSILT